MAMDAPWTPCGRSRIRAPGRHAAGGYVTRVRGGVHPPGSHGKAMKATRRPWTRRGFGVASGWFWGRVPGGVGAPSVIKSHWDITYKYK